jgi:hypothetical protein
VDALSTEDLRPNLASSLSRSCKEALDEHRHFGIARRYRYAGDPRRGRDSMLLNLSGAHGPLFTRNIVIVKDSAGNTGLGEVPGGEPIARRWRKPALVVGRPLGQHNARAQRDCAAGSPTVMPAAVGCKHSTSARRSMR